MGSSWFPTGHFHMLRLALVPTLTQLGEGGVRQLLPLLPGSSKTLCFSLFPRHSREADFGKSRSAACLPKVAGFRVSEQPAS